MEIKQKSSVSDHYLIGPFKQVLTLRQLNDHGPLSDEQLEVLEDIGVEINQGKIIALIPWSQRKQGNTEIVCLDHPYILTPGLVDCHTHLCYAELYHLLKQRIMTHQKRGITTLEIKSGYGLSVADEYLHLKLIQQLQQESLSTIIATCLAAHVCPPEFSDKEEYLSMIAQELLPKIKAEHLCHRVDAFVEDSAFPASIIKPYLQYAQTLGFDLTIHADQFSSQGSKLAGDLKAKSADHLEVSQKEDLEALRKGNVVAVALPGASMGLGCGYAPVRQALDLGLSVAIASDWNPGSAPMGDLMLQASVMGMACRLNSAEIWASMTTRAAKALGIDHLVGKIDIGYQADLLVYDCEQWQDILYQQGQLKPKMIIVRGIININ
jgi:imidazolonepropionase